MIVLKVECGSLLSNIMGGGSRSRPSPGCSDPHLGTYSQASGTSVLGAKAPKLSKFPPKQEVCMVRFPA